MSPLAAKILIVGIPFILSLSWFLFWVLRLTSASRKNQSASGGANKSAKNSRKAHHR